MNLDKFCEEMVLKMKSVNLCSNTVGMIAMALMLDPPTEGRESSQTVNSHKAEMDKIFSGLKHRAVMLNEKLNSVEGISCTDIEGAMYAFPKLHFPEHYLEKAKKAGSPADAIYCMEMLEKTGIMTVPGSGCGQVDGTYHFRLTNLIADNSEMESALD